MEKFDRSFVIIDIIHYPHVNFYKHAIETLTKKNIGVHVILRPRGKLVSIFQKECPDVSYVLIGKYKKTIFSKTIGMIKRDIAFLNYLRKIEFEVGTGISSDSLAHTTHFFKKPYINFGDDVEYKLGYYLVHPFSTRDVIPKSVPSHGKNLLKYDGFKELAYLHPNHFKPNKKALEPYNFCLLYTSPSPRDRTRSRMPSSA